MAYLGPSSGTAAELPHRPLPSIISHPLCPLNASEITTSADLLRACYPSEIKLQFKAITLQEPLKSEVVEYLAATYDNKPTKEIKRRAFVAYYIRNTDKFHEAIVNVTDKTVERNVRLGEQVHGSSDGGELLALEKIMFEDESVKKEIEKLQLPAGTTVVCDPWIYGSDGKNDEKRMFQCFLFAKPGDADCNYYAFPLAISPVLDSVAMKVIRIDHMPTGTDCSTTETKPYKVQPLNEYTPEHQKLRTDLKPLNIVQPEGTSFAITSLGETGHTVKWQKWSFMVGFNYREGMVLYDIRYDGRLLFYRLSLAEMSIPYADPRAPFHKKAAFDLGDAGAGVLANNLQLGCDCLGTIQYLDSVLHNENGEAVEMPNVICVHEQDGGIGWKHTNYRTNRAAIVRSRELVLQSIITAANYEYIFAFYFNQAGELTYEVKATGILSTQPIDEGVKVPWGTVVHPGVLAAHHQHIFSLRIDPSIDGHNNSVVYSEAHALPRDKELNPFGTGYILKETPIDQSGGYDIDYTRNGSFKIANTSSKNPVNGISVAYKIQVPPCQKLLSDDDSFHYKRAEFADRSVYVTKYQEDELYPAGRYTNQSRGGTGVRTWSERKDNVKDTDIVVWVQFGINHIPRTEDFPVMPCETIRVHLKPVNFFVKNPAIDVPPSEQSVNKSSLVGSSVEKSKCCS